MCISVSVMSARSIELEFGSDGRQTICVVEWPNGEGYDLYVNQTQEKGPTGRHIALSNEEATALVAALSLVNLPGKSSA